MLVSLIPISFVPFPFQERSDFRCNSKCNKKKIFVVVIILIFVIAFHFFARNIDFLFMIVALLLFYMNQVKIITKVVD